MTANTTNRKTRLLLLLSLILIGGFLTTSLAGYYVALSSMRHQITTSALPLTSDNIYSEIQRDLLRPIFISSLMANDTFLRDWVLNGEQGDTQITRYLKEVMNKYDTFTSFFVSETTRTYYHANGILKKIKPDEKRDKWYFRVQAMEPDYEINVDPDMANRDAMTIFINHKVYDYDQNFIGVTGVGLTINSAMSLMETYRKKYERNIYFINPEGTIVLRSASFQDSAKTIQQIEGISTIADRILSNDGDTFQYIRQGSTVHLNSRYVPEMHWYLLVEQTEGGLMQNIHSTLFINLALCAFITAIVILLTTITINTYQKTNQKQQQELLEKNVTLAKALVEVKKLSGLLPICSSCKKIRNDKGYWQQIEIYIREHSEADFSHGICPDCIRELYPGLLLNKTDHRPPEEPTES